MKHCKLCQWVCRVCETQHRLQRELSGSWNANAFFCLLGITHSKAALRQSSRAWLYFCRAPVVCRWNCVFFSVNCLTCVLFTGVYPSPNSCLNATIVPICKNKNGKMSDTSNYWTVAVATVVSKLLEHFILSNISPFLGTKDNQFSFKAGHSTDQCICILPHTL